MEDLEKLLLTSLDILFGDDLSLMVLFDFIGLVFVIWRFWWSE